MDRLQIGALLRLQVDRAIIMILVVKASHRAWHDAAGVLGGEQMLRLLTQPLSAETASGSGVNWRTAEAAL